MKHKTITSQEQYEAIAVRIEELVNAAPNTEEAKELKRLTRLIAEFESRRGAASPEQSQMI